MDDQSQRAVELGTGLGRLLKHYHGAGFDIVVMERSEVAVEQLKSEGLGIDIRAGDVRDMPFADAEFDVVLAFGLYHNFEDCVDRALEETARILRDGGRFCVSIRPDNFEMRFNEWYWRWRERNRRGSPLRFHRWLAGESDFRGMLAMQGLVADRMYRARIVSLLYRVPFPRAKSRTEAERRPQGYRLNNLGRTVHLSPSCPHSIATSLCS